MGVLLLASGTTELSVCMRMSLSTIIVGSREHLGRCQCGRRGERQSAEDPGRDSQVEWCLADVWVATHDCYGIERPEV